MESFLQNRSLFVISNNTVSQLKECSTGVPRGSILGRIMFLMYINDLPVNIKAKTILYADDTTLINKGVDHTQIKN